VKKIFSKLLENKEKSKEELNLYSAKVTKEVARENNDLHQMTGNISYKNR